LQGGSVAPAVVAVPPPPAAAVAAKPAANDGATRLVIRAVLSSEPVPEPEPHRKSWVLPIVIVVAVLGLGWAGVHWFMGQPDSGAASSDAGSTGAAATAAPADGSATAGADAPSSGEAAPGGAASQGAASSGVPATSGAPEASPGSATRTGVAPAASPSSRGSTRAVSSSDPAVLHEEIPNIPLHSRETIHGHVKVIVRVTVDKSGTVVSDVLENPGPSKYFARVAGQAASKWKFAPAGHENTRQWLVRFEFSRDGTKANAVLRN